MVELTVGFGKQSTRVRLPAGATLQQLGDELAAAYGVAPATIKLMRIGAGGGGGGSMIKLQEQADQTLEEAGQGRGGEGCALPGVAFGLCQLLRFCRSLALCLAACPAQPACTAGPAAGIAPGARLKMLASRPADVEAVQGQREDSRVPGFDTELRRQLRRAGVADGDGGANIHTLADGDGGSGAKQALPSGPYTFQRFEAWQRPGLIPPPAEALKLLHRWVLAARAWLGGGGVYVAAAVVAGGSRPDGCLPGRAGTRVPHAPRLGCAVSVAAAAQPHAACPHYHAGAGWRLTPALWE